MYNYIKALHLIFVITWFSGLFYIVRLFVYQIEAAQKPMLEKQILQKQYQLMAYRLWYIITWPSAVLASFFAFWLLHLNPNLIALDYMQVKFGFVALLYVYHFKCHQIFVQLQNNCCTYSANFMRIWNEGATIILFSIVFLIIVKSAINWIYGTFGLILFSIIIMLGFQFYKKIRHKNKT